MIDEALAKRVRERLSVLSGECLENFNSEIQDGATFLFLTCRLPYGGPAEVPAQLRSTIVVTLNEIVPSDASQELGSWQLNVYRGGALADALFPQEV